MANDYYYPTSKNGIQKTLAAQLLNTATTGDAITFADVDGVQNKPGVLVINRVDSNGTDTTSAREFISYSGTSGNTVLIETRNVDGSGATRTHAINSVVEFVADGIWAQRIIDQALVGHEVTGAHKASLTFTTPTLTSPVLNTGVSGTAVLDEDDMSSNSATALATQQSIKAYVDSGTVTMTNKTLTSPVINGMSGWDGWVTSTDTWTYASASTFTIAGVDRTAIYTKGTRLKFTQTTVKYAVVVSSSFSTNTTVTIAVNTDYTIANAAITDNDYSYQANPAGYPHFFAFTPTWAGFSANPAGAATRYSIIGNVINYQLFAGTGTSNSTSFTITLPVAIASYYVGQFITGVALGVNAGTSVNTFITGGSTTRLDLYTSAALAGWTNSGNKGVWLNASFEF